MGKHSYIVERVLVIYRDGRLIVDCAREGCETEDADIMSGMLIAVQGLIRDGLESGGAVRSIVYGDNVIRLASGEYVVLAAVLFGTADDAFCKALEETLASIEARYASDFIDWPGDPERVRGALGLVEPLVSRTARVSRDEVMDVRTPDPPGEAARNLLHANRDIIINLERRLRETAYCDKCGSCVDRLETFQCPMCRRVLCAGHRDRAGEPCDDCRKVLRQQADVRDTFYDRVSGSIQHDRRSVGGPEVRARGAGGRMGLLEVHLPGGERRVVYLTREGLRDYIRIGRDSSNDIVIADRRVSRNHAQLLPAKDGVYLLDSCSTGGVRVNDERVVIARLPDGALITIGEQLLFFSKDLLSLVFMSGPEEGRTVLLGKVSIARDYNIGRCPTNEVVIDDRSVSRHHARVLVQGDELFIEDIGSARGTSRNGRAVDGLTRLEDGDTIAVGAVEMTFRR